MTIIRWTLIMLGMAFLSACFISKGDLISPKDADYPIESGTSFSIYSLEPDGTRSKDAPQHVKVTRKNAFYSVADLDDRDEAHVIGLMDDIDQGNYIALMHDSDHPGQSVYGAFTRKGVTWLRHTFVCSDFEKLAGTHGKAIKDFGIAKAGSDCLFSNYADLKSAVSFELQYGKPDAEYVPAK